MILPDLLFRYPRTAAWTVVIVAAIVSVTVYQMWVPG